MVWREDRAPGPKSASATKVAMMVMVMSFLLVSVALLALQPRPEADRQQIIAEPVRVAPAPPAPIPDTEAPETEIAAPVAPPTPPASIVVESQVTRSDASLLELREAMISRHASQVLRSVAQSGAPLDLPTLARDVLQSFEYPVAEGDRLHALLVSALSNQKSDAFIDALLNTAAARGAFTPPPALVLPDGRMDTETLLQAVIFAAQI